jgi:hypothetical protein
MLTKLIVMFETSCPLSRRTAKSHQWDESQLVRNTAVWDIKWFVTSNIIMLLVLQFENMKTFEAHQDLL